MSDKVISLPATLFLTILEAAAEHVDQNAWRAEGTTERMEKLWREYRDATREGYALLDAWEVKNGKVEE